MSNVKLFYTLGYVWFLLTVDVESHLQKSSTGGSEAAPEFSQHSVIRPRVFHGREKRELASTRDEDGQHVHDVVVNIADNDGRDWLLDLQLNRDLLPKSYFERYQQQGRDVITRPTVEDIDLCHYKGSVRGVADSWVAISTCKGLSGVIFDGNDLHYIEPRNGNHSDEHLLYRHEHLLSNQTCGFPDTPHHILGAAADEPTHRILRYKRSIEESGSQGVIRGPYNANKQSRYVELVLVVDTMEYKEFGSIPEVSLHCKKIANIINALYVPLNIFVALVGVVVWTELDDIKLSASGDTTLANFLHYRRGRLAQEHPNDNAQLLTRMQFDGGVVGKALKGPICTYEFSGGVSVDHSSVVGLVATTVAHEMGHNFGMEHDTSNCSCPSERCIMAPSSNSKHPTHWSSCSLRYLADAFEHGMDYCLRNKPERLHESPVCGNGFVEPGEQCDCGLPEYCNNPCCNASACMLFANASCATGECCDLATCKPRRAGYKCRSADHECDLPEFCTGESEFCPNNVFKMDGEKCDKGKAFCYQGSCRTHSDQCRLLWGPSGASSDSECYKMNTKGSQHGNCGYNRLNHSYIQCGEENVMCGMLHCKHLNERLEFGMESVAILSQTFLNTGGNVIPCRTAIVDLGLNEVDPGLAPDGATCGPGKMCVNQKCLAVDALQKAACPNNCHGRGICNSRGHCHCDVGYSPPYCADIGFGGSADSGPATDPNADSGTTNFLIFLFAVLFMAIILLLAVFYTRYWRFKKKPACNNVGLTGAASSHGRTEKDGRRAVDISSPLSPADSARTSLLTSSNEPVLNGIIGHHKGFTIKPLPATSVENSAKVPAAAIPTRPAPARPTETTPLPVCANATNSSRPVISSPVLDATTLTAQQLISKAMPTAGAEPREIRLPKQASEPPLDPKILRQAPSPPAAAAGYTPLAVSSPTKPRPLSSPTALTAPEPVPNVKVVREGSTSTLSRIASIFHPNSKNNSGSKPKLDREALRSLEISKPIPQQEIEIPGAKEALNRPVVMRAHSLRDQGPVTPRPSIPNFGSMRGRRPVSIPTARPTSPPPRPPPAKPAATTVEYDDCLNVQSSAPLANIDEEMPSPTDNIYAVIEECPPITSPGQGSKKVEYTSPTGEYQSPRPVENTVSAGSTESVGLLSEIVNEMQARNMESIYTSTLGRKRKKKEEEESRARKGETGEGRKSKKESSPTSPKGIPLASQFPDRASSISTSNSSLGTYVNAPYTSSKPGTGVYTNVASRNSPTPSQGSSQAGYLSPNPVVTSPPIPSSMPVVSTAAPTATTHSAFSTFKGPSKLDSVRNPSLAPAPYKPFTSTLQRPSGPLSGLRSTTPKPAADEKKSTDSSFVSKASDSSIPNNSLQSSKPPSSSVVKSVLAAVENSKKSEVNKPTSFRSAEKKSPSESKPLEIEKKGIKTGTSMANRPLPEKPTNAQKSQSRTKPGLTTTTPTTGKPPATSTVAVEKPSTFKSKVAAVPQSSVHKSKVPPTPPPPQNKPNKSSPDVVASCSKEQGNREPDVVSPAGNPSGGKLLLERQPSLESKSGTSGSRPRVAPAPVSRGVSHVASLQQKFETAASNTDPSKTKSKNPPPVSVRLLPETSSSSHKGQL